MKKHLEKKLLQEQREQQSLCLAPHASASQDTIDHIHVGSFYELDHSKLPPSAPAHINSIRIVMVDEKSLFKVSVRFPSLHSLQTHLNEKSYRNPVPALNENFEMTPITASEVLYRRLPHREIQEQSRVWSFWTVRRRFVASPCCLSEIKLSGMVQWGKRKLVRCVTVHESPSRSDKDEQVQAEKEEKEMDEDVKESRYEFRKRKQIQKKLEIVKRQKQGNNQIVVHDETQKQMVEGSIQRWTARRYKAAEENIYKVMKEKGVCAENPIRRGPLRFEARKLIGDTGLIDHLLKHMAGKVAPGGVDRFRRRHNADGALEYWLESADLMRIREEAGVKDPYWTPRPGWKIGDNPTQDPICVRMFKEVWDEIANMRREREVQQQQENLAVITLDQGEAYSSVTNSKESMDKYTELAVKKSRIEEQMLQVSQSFSGIEEKMESLLEELRVLKPTMEESALVYSETAEVPMLISDTAGGTKDKMGSREKGHIEDKAAKIERLRSSFKICKPQGTFMWPDRCMSPKGMLQQTDSFLVPTPPSVSSSNKSATRLVLHTPNGLNPGSPLKPLAERRAVNISTLNNVIKLPEKTNTPLQVDSIRIGKSIDLNLNEFPDAYNTESTAIPGTLTYQRKHQDMAKAKRNVEDDTDIGKDIMGLLRYNAQHQQRRSSSSSFTSST